MINEEHELVMKFKVGYEHYSNKFGVMQSALSKTITSIAATYSSYIDIFSLSIDLLLINNIRIKILLK